MQPARPEHPTFTVPMLPAEQITAGTHTVSDFTPEQLTDGIVGIGVQPQDLGIGEYGATYLNTPHGYVPLQPGTVVDMLTPDTADNFLTSQHYIDAHGILRGVLYNQDGTPRYHKVVTSRMGRIAAQTAEAVHAGTAAPAPDTSMQAHTAFVVDHDPNAVVGVGADVPSAQEYGTMNLSGEFVPGEPEPAEQAAGPAQGRARVPLPLDMHFTVGDAHKLNETLRREDEANDALTQAAAIMDEAVQQVASEHGRGTTDPRIVSMDELLDIGTAQDNSRTQRIPQQRTAATSKENQQPPAEPEQKAGGRHHRETKLRSRLANAARAIGERVLSLGRNGRHTAPGRNMPLNHPTATAAPSVDNMAGGRHRAAHAPGPAPVPVIPGQRLPEPGQHRERAGV